MTIFKLCLHYTLLCHNCVTACSIASPCIAISVTYITSLSPWHWATGTEPTLLHYLFQYVFLCAIYMLCYATLCSVMCLYVTMHYIFRGISTLHTEPPDYLLYISLYNWQGYLGGGDWGRGGCIQPTIWPDAYRLLFSCVTMCSVLSQYVLLCGSMF